MLNGRRLDFRNCFLRNEGDTGVAGAAGGGAVTVATIAADTVAAATIAIAVAATTRRSEATRSLDDLQLYFLDLGLPFFTFLVQSLLGR